MSEKPHQAREEARAGLPAIIRIDPAVAEKFLFEKIPIQARPDEDVMEHLRKYKGLSTGPGRVAALVHIMMLHYTSAPLGLIIPPQNGAGIIKDRIAQSAEIILGMLREEVDKLEKEIEASIASKEDVEVEKKVRELVQLHLDAITAIREIMNRYLTLYHTNLPSHLRPPLIQVKLGMDVVSRV